MEKKDTASSAAGKAREENAAIAYSFFRENIKERLLAVVDSHSATGADLCNLLKEVLQKQNIDVFKCISNSTDRASNMLGQYNEFTAKNLLVTFTHGATCTFST